MKNALLKQAIWIIAALSLLAGCTTTAPVTQPAGYLRVIYSRAYPDGSVLKEMPTEVRLVTRQATQNNVAAQVGLNVLLLSIGGFGFQGFSKDDLSAKTVSGLQDRRHLKNPIPTEFVDRLQARVDDAIKAESGLQSRVFGKPLVVGGGSTRLVYENLLGTGEEEFRLKTDLTVYRSRSGMMTRPMVIDCAAESPQPMPQSRWAEDNYLPVKMQLDEMLMACETKVLASLGSLLED